MKPSAMLPAFAAGLLFGAGLLVSGMTIPANVANFLDVTGTWDPTLGFVMGGAIAVHAVLYRLIIKRSSPLFDTQFYMPSLKHLDWKLLTGAGLFGIGWGIGGFCPGPALVSVAGGAGGAAIFIVAMLGAMFVEQKTFN